MVLWPADTHEHFLDWPVSDGRRRSRALSPRPGTRGLCVCRGSFFSTSHSSPLARVRALMFQSRVEEDPGVLPGRSSYSRAPVSGRRFQCPPPHAGTSAGPSRPHWPVCSAPGCPWPLLAKRWPPLWASGGQGQHLRKTPEGFECRRWDLSWDAFPCPGDFVLLKITRPSA